VHDICDGCVTAATRCWQRNMMKTFKLPRRLALEMAVLDGGRWYRYRILSGGALCPSSPSLAHSHSAKRLQTCSHLLVSGNLSGRSVRSAFDRVPSHRHNTLIQGPLWRCLECAFAICQSSLWCCVEPYESGHLKGPLHGVPISIKDSCTFPFSLLSSGLISLISSDNF
jgi:hypothetical protein